MTTHMNILSIFCISAALSLSACATMTKGTHEEVKINSAPAGAKAVSDVYGRDGEKISCEPTPCVLNLPRKTRPRVTVSKEGYQPIIFALASSRATSASALQTGAIVAGSPEGSHVLVGSPELLKRVPVSVTVAGNAFFTLGAAVPIDAATGANLSLSPNPVTVILAPAAKEAPIQNTSDQNASDPKPSDPKPSKPSDETTKDDAS